MFGVIIHFYLKENFYYFYIQETPQCTFHSVWWHIFSAFVFSSLAMWAIDFGPRHCLPSDGWSSHHIAVIGGGPRSFHQLSLSSFVFWVNLYECDGGAGFPVDCMSQLGLPLDNAVSRENQSYNTGQAERRPTLWDPHPMQSLPAQPSCAPPRW